MKLMHNVAVYAMDKDFTTGDAIVWDGKRIIEVGKRKALFERYKEAEKIDGEGKTVLPGFIDPHIHFMDGVLLKGVFDCSSENITSIDSLRKTLSDVVHDFGKEQWIIGQGYDPWAFTDKKGPDRYDLDEICPDNPVMIIHYSLHESVVNSMALEIAGIDRNTPQPFGGEIVKDKEGNPTGHLVETAHTRLKSFARKSQIKRLHTELGEKLHTEQEMLFGFGITRIGDPAVSSPSRDLYQKVSDNGFMSIPVFMYPCNDENNFELPWDKVDGSFSWRNSDSLMVGPLKIFLDGADRAAVVLTFKQFLKTFYMTIRNSIRSKSFDPIRTSTRSPFRLGKDLKLHFGVKMAKAGECHKLVSTAIERGFTVAFHAIGNEAVKQVIETMERSGGKHKDYPPARIEHGLFLDDELIRKIRELHMAVVTQPYFLTHMDKENVPHLPGIKQLPLRSLIDAGVPVAGGSDWPVASCDPLLAVERAVTRVTTGTEILQENEAISVKEAFAMYTCWAAEILGCSQDVGSLEPGKRSDFIVLSADPFTGSKVKWDDLKVIRTFLCGEMVFSEVDES
jgi:predicted amidohydrolase YtcJ